MRMENNQTNSLNTELASYDLVNWDNLDTLKYVGLCLSSLPPEGIKTTKESFINFVRFQLSLEKKVLLKDKIWDSYSDEELIVEYFAILFSKNEEVKKEFESKVLSNNEDILDYFDREIEKNRVELEKIKRTKDGQ